MDKSQERRRFAEAATGLGEGLSEAAIDGLFLLRDELLRWNAKVNLTAINNPQEVLEKHFLDSLGALSVSRGTRVLDVGSGGGFPGLVWALARPTWELTLVDTVAKKVGFLKHAASRLGFGTRVRGLHLRLEGQPQAEGVGTFDTVVSRALMDVGPWLRLAQAYVAPGGEVLALVARAPVREELESLARAAGLRLEEVKTYALPASGDPRAVLRFVRP